MSVSNMDQLVKVINKLQDVFASLSMPNAIELPQIVILQLIKTGADSGISSPGASSTDEWGVFNHIPDKKLFNFDEIRDEIITETDAKTGGNKSKGSAAS
ncbi:hypothetical protein DI09_12p320 [Mitosporidium daphniae]|uniref:Uncharacterized protein n=1 Tax=Mitosporidium daphniae TaxID=1485682 RepID=A0A098VVM2_9MICR|nr:uncharacterized protein DI09_12p320 [Mitosporidium daphniae]KGG52864.1 hypothetical protein DI09_12p320 [Mitosporidium daphniae]|eukprot:XP_013239291.1 uncharacterized protein DI09_12p320 [Mitosporidium daphniae]